MSLACIQRCLLRAISTHLPKLNASFIFEPHHWQLCVLRMRCTPGCKGRTCASKSVLKVNLSTSTLSDTAHPLTVSMTHGMFRDGTTAMKVTQYLQGCEYASQQSRFGKTHCFQTLFAFSLSSALCLCLLYVCPLPFDVASAICTYGWFRVHFDER